MKNLAHFVSVLILTLCVQALQAQNIVGYSGLFTFDTKAPVVTVLGPNGGENISYLTPLQVTWNATDDNLKPLPISIQLITQPGNNISYLAQNIANTGIANITLPAIVRDQVKIRIIAKDIFGNQGFDESADFFKIGTSNLSVSFLASPLITSNTTLIQFTDLSTGTPSPTSWTWDFGDNQAVSYDRNPSHTYTNPGSYNVKLTIDNGQGMSTKTISNYITITSADNGIELRIVETAGTSEVKWAGYEYTYTEPLSQNPLRMKKQMLYFPVNNGISNINEFVNASEFNTLYLTLYADFDDVIFLFKEENGLQKQVGHIDFNYEHSREKIYTRNATLIFHNDDEMKKTENIVYFPYGTNTKEYDKKWNYYKIGEYPVSMLIPPNNTNPQIFNKQPLLLVHGWGGTYNYKTDPDAVPEQNEVSYWFTIPKTLNKENNIFQAWQYYYPYDTDIPHLGKCLKSALSILKEEYPNYKIGIVTHSMGGLVVSEYITSETVDAKDKLYKVLFSAPPMHGSIGANKHYKTSLGLAVEVGVNKDRDAPAPRDMSLGSQFLWTLQNKTLVDLNGEIPNSIEDDYFVLLGTTKNRFGFAQYVHDESSNHNDGIVAMSSASMTDRNIGFASFHGNHDDAIHFQSKKRNDINNQNIGNPFLMPYLIKSYFTESYPQFLSTLVDQPNIEAVVRHDRAVVGPLGQNWSNISTGETDVNYKKSILGFRILPPNPFPLGLWPSTFLAYYDASTRKVIASPVPINLFGHNRVGEFIKNRYNSNGCSYYFSYNPILLNGSAYNFEQGQNTITIKDCFYRSVFSSQIEINYCQTTLLPFQASSKSAADLYTDQTDLKFDTIQASSSVHNEIVNTNFWIHPKDTVANFVCFANDLNFIMKIQTPTGIVLDSTFAGGTFTHNAATGEYAMEITNPETGNWKVRAESDETGYDTLQYSAITYMKSKLHAYNVKNSEVVAAGSNYRLSVGIEMENTNLTDSLEVKATLIKTNGTTQVIDISVNPFVSDSSLVFQGNYIVDSSGYYLIKYNIDGVYDGNRFERAIYQQFEASDTIAFIKVEDIKLGQLQQMKEIDLIKCTYNIDNVDSLSFSAQIITLNEDSALFNVSLDSTMTKLLIYSSLADTGTIDIRVNCNYMSHVYADTMNVKIELPELHFNSTTLSDSLLNRGDSFIISNSIANSGNVYSGEYDIRYYLSEDSIWQAGDNCIGTRIILQHSPDSILQVTDTLQLPLLNSFGNAYLLLQIDAAKTLIEIDGENNTSIKNILLNGKPSAPVITSALADSNSAHILWRDNESANIAGYYIYYDTDSIAPFAGDHNENGSSSPIILHGADSSYSLQGLFNDTTYFVTITGYNIFGLESDLSNIVSVRPTIPKRILRLNVFLEALYDSTGEMKQAKDELGPHFVSGIADRITFELHSAVTDYGIVYSTDGYLKTDGTITLVIPAYYNGVYYLTIKHRNSIETWSASPVSFSSDTVTYNFTDANSKAFGNNLKAVNGKHLIYSGDVNQDGFINPGDIILVTTDCGEFVTGYVATDVNGDGVIDALDLIIIDNNASNFIEVEKP